MNKMTDWNENYELNEQNLEQVAGGQISQISRGDITITYRCPKCGATQKVKSSPGIKPYGIRCRNCLEHMVEA